MRKSIDGLGILVVDVLEQVSLSVTCLSYIALDIDAKNQVNHIFEGKFILVNFQHDTIYVYNG